MPPELEAFARSQDEKLRVPRARVDQGRVRDPREGFTIAGVANRDARAVYDARSAAMRALWAEGQAGEAELLELGELLHDALRLGLWRARRVTDFAAFVEEVIGIPAARARALADAHAQRAGQPLEALSERAVAAWLRTEAGLYEGDAQARVRVRAAAATAAASTHALEIRVSLAGASRARAGSGARHAPLAREQDEASLEALALGSTSAPGKPGARLLTRRQSEPASDASQLEPQRSQRDAKGRGREHAREPDSGRAWRGVGDKRAFGGTRGPGDRPTSGEQRRSGAFREAGEQRGFGDRRAHTDERGTGERRGSGDKRAAGERRGFGDRRGAGRDGGDKRGAGESRGFGDERGAGERRGFGGKRGAGRGFADERGTGERRGFAEERGTGERRGAGGKRGFAGKRGFGDAGARSEPAGFGEKRPFSRHGSEPGAGFERPRRAGKQRGSGSAAKELSRAQRRLDKPAGVPEKGRGARSAAEGAEHDAGRSAQERPARARDDAGEE